MMFSNYPKTLQASLLLIVAAALIFSGCGSSSSENDTGGTLQISSLTATPTTITIGQTSVIVATISDGSSAQQGHEVTFSTTPTYGTISVTTDTTDTGGEAITQLTATQTGTAIITAELPGNITRAISVLITDTTSGGGDPGTGNIHVTAYPTIIVGDGIDSTLITITVFDANGGIAPDGTMINITAGEKFDDIDKNGFFTAGVDTVIYDINNNGMWDPIGTIVDTMSVSGGNGQAQAYFYAGTMASTVYVRATVTILGYAGFGEATVQMNATANIASIFLASSEIHMSVKQTGGMETAMLFATGYDSYGNKVPAGIPVNFIITDGPDTSSAGEHLGNLTGALKRGPYLAYTNSVGMAECPISSGTVSGTVRIRAYSDTVFSNATQIMVHAGPPARITVATEECNVNLWHIVGGEIEVIAQVSDVYNNPVNDMTAVYFTTEEGVIKAHESWTTGENGIASTTWFSWGSDAASDGVVLITAETNGGTLSSTGGFVNSHVPDILQFTSFPNTMDADNFSKGFMYVGVVDFNGNPVINDYLVDIKFDAEFLTFGVRENGDGCWESGVSNYLLSKVLDQDFSLTGGNDDGIGLVEDVTARWGYLSSVTRPCTLLTGNAFRDNCNLNIENSSPNFGDVVYFSVKIADRSGNPLGDHTIVASVSAGSLPVNTYETDAYGTANGFNVTMPADSSGGTSVTITVQDIDTRGNIFMQERIDITAK